MSQQDFILCRCRCRFLLVMQRYFIEKYILSDCEELQKPDNGSVSDLSHFHHGDTVIVHCEDNFTLSGDSTLTCTSGKWSGTVGKCKPGENIEIIHKQF
ncbi:MAG: CCP domain-containing protein [Candidatus Thiodiazotropha sp.]